MLAAAGCASTRAFDMGPLPGGHRLVTVVVTRDLDVIQRECHGPPELLPVLGCTQTRPVKLAGGQDAVAVRIVRYAEPLPSRVGLEIDAHELCHVVAALQKIADPCHLENDGFVQAWTGSRAVFGR